MPLVQVTVCKEGNDCPETVTLARDDSRLLTEFSSSVPLELCTDYSLHIKPVCLYLSTYLCIYLLIYFFHLSTKVWPAADLYDKVVNFRTLSPPLANLTSSLASSSVHMSGDQVKYQTCEIIL